MNTLKTRIARFRSALQTLVAGAALLGMLANAASASRTRAVYAVTIYGQDNAYDGFGWRSLPVQTGYIYTTAGLSGNKIDVMVCAGVGLIQSGASTAGSINTGAVLFATNEAMFTSDSRFPSLSTVLGIGYHPLPVDIARAGSLMTSNGLEVQAIPTGGATTFNLNFFAGYGSGSTAVYARPNPTFQIDSAASFVSGIAPGLIFMIGKNNALTGCMQFGCSADSGTLAGILGKQVSYFATITGQYIRTETW